MTVLVGILCSDGVVIASDSAATYTTGLAQTIGQQVVTKIWSIDNSVLYAATGAIGIAQLLAGAIEGLWKNKELSATKASTPVAAMERIGKEIVQRVETLQRSAAVLASLVGEQAAGASSMAKSLVAMPFKKKAHLFQFDNNGAPEQATDELPFVALGIGQPIADPFLAFLKRVLWTDKKPTIAEARFVAAWTVNHVITTIPGGVGPPIQLATLIVDEPAKVEFISPAEHLQQIEITESALRSQIRSFQKSEVGAPAPPVPMPDR